MKGSLTVKNGKYHIVISYKDEDGVHKKKWVATGLDEKNNKRAAEEKMRTVVAEFKDNALMPKSDTASEQVLNPLFADYLEDWLELSKPNLQVSTYSTYKENVKQIANYFRGKRIKLQDLRPADIIGYYQHIIKSGGSIQKCEHHHVNIHRALQVAYRTEMIPINPADKVERPRSPKYQAKYFDYKKMLHFFDSLSGDRFELIYFTASMTGLRRSEICGIKWSAIDFDRNVVHINHSIVQTKVNGKVAIVPKDIMKNKTSRRTLPIIPILKQKMLEEKANQERRSKFYGASYSKKWQEYMCVDEIGDLIKPSTISSHFELLLKQSGLPKIRFHDLRHSFASLLLACGASLKEVSEWLGHSTITITSDLYGHLDFNSKLTVANTIAKLFGYETVDTDEQSPYEIIRNLFTGVQSNRWETSGNDFSAPQAANPVVSPAPDTFYDQATPSVSQRDTNSIEEYKAAKQEMQRLGFGTLDEYFDYLDFLATKQERTKSSGIEM